MLIRHMSTADRHPRTLDLFDGLNILQSPAGSGDWCPLLLSMFYGEPALPGRLDCRAGDDALVLLRKKTSPAFRALYAGTDTAVPGLTAATCGQTLLGADREVFTRSALIRRDAVAGFGADSLLEEPGSASLPALESELREMESLLAIREQLIQKLARLRDQAAETQRRIDTLASERAALDHQEARQQQQALAEAEEAALQAQQRADRLRSRIAEEAIPDNKTIARLRGAIVNLETQRKSAVKAQAQRDEAERALRQAEEASAGSPFAGLTMEEAQQRSLDLPPKPHYPVWGVILALILGLALGAALFVSAKQGLPLSVGCGCGLGGVTLLLGGLYTGKQQHHWEDMAIQHRKQWQTALETHAVLCRNTEEALAKYNEKAAAFEQLDAPLRTVEADILQEIHRFAPAAGDIAAGDAALRASAILRKGLVEIDAAAEAARLRRDQLAQAVPESLPPAPEDFTRTPRSRDILTADTEAAQAKLTSLLDEAKDIAARLQEAGDPAALRDSAERLADRIAALHAAPKPQPQPPRYSPAVERHAEKILANLTGGAATFAPDPNLQRLTLHLASSQLDLPEEKGVPLILDDVLSLFDDAHCAAVLRWLREEAERRQVLLFTSQSREAAFFAGDPSVSIQHLTDPA